MTVRSLIYMEGGLESRRLRFRSSITKTKIHSSREIEDFVETHLCKLCVVLRSRVLRVVVTECQHSSSSHGCELHHRVVYLAMRRLSLIITRCGGI